MSTKKRSSWAIGDGLLGWVKTNVAFRTPAMELGSGEGSPLLGDHLAMVSVEHDPLWVPVAAKNHVPCVFAPIHEGWYDMATMVSLVKAVRPELVIVDGPPAAIGRGGFAALLPVLHSCCPHVCIVFDDSQRGAEAALAQECQRGYPGSDLVYFKDGEKAFTVLAPRVKAPCLSDGWRLSGTFVS